MTLAYLGNLVTCFEATQYLFKNHSYDTSGSTGFLLFCPPAVPCFFVMAFDEKDDDPKVDATYESASISLAHEESVSHEERLLVRKLDRRILPIACLMYLFACQSSRIPCYHRFHHRDPRFGQKQLGQRSSTGPTCRCTSRGS